MLNDYPLVTVVTATYNHFESLFASIDSVFNQDYPNIEYIISDDGSSDFPYERISQYLELHKSKNIKNLLILTTEKNRGTVRNINHAYKTSKGKYLINLSCGDIFFSADVVRNIVKRFISCNADVIVTSRVVYQELGHPIAFLPHYAERKTIKRKYNSSFTQYKAFVLGLSYDMASGSAMSYSKTIMEKLGYFDERYCLFEDGPFLLKYLLKSELCYAYDIISIWYQTSGISSVSGTSRNPIYQKDLDLFNQVDRKACVQKLSYSERKKLDFCFAYMNTNGNAKMKIAAVLRYFPYSLCYIRYYFARIINTKKDWKYLKEYQGNANKKK